jgi:hypothetical protein
MKFTDTLGRALCENDIVAFRYKENEIYYDGYGRCRIVDENLYIYTDGRSIHASKFICIYKELDTCQVDNFTMQVSEFYGIIKNAYWKRDNTLTHVIEFEAPNGDIFQFGNIDLMKHSASKYLNVLMHVVGTNIDAATLVGKGLHCTIENNQVVAIADLGIHIHIMDLRNLYDEEV